MTKINYIGAVCIEAFEGYVRGVIYPSERIATPNGQEYYRIYKHPDDDMEYYEVFIVDKFNKYFKEVKNV